MLQNFARLIRLFTLSGKHKGGGVSKDPQQCTIAVLCGSFMLPAAVCWLLLFSRAVLLHSIRCFIAQYGVAMRPTKDWRVAALAPRFAAKCWCIPRSGVPHAGMNYDTEKSIDLSFRMLVGLWLAGALCLALALAAQVDAPPTCTMMQLHFDACPD